MDCSPPGSSVQGILQARILVWVAVTPSRDLPHPGIEPTSLASCALAGRFFTTSTTWEARVLMDLCPVPWCLGRRAWDRTDQRWADVHVAGRSGEG